MSDVHGEWVLVCIVEDQSCPLMMHSCRYQDDSKDLIVSLGRERKQERLFPLSNRRFVCVKICGRELWEKRPMTRTEVFPSLKAGKTNYTVSQVVWNVHTVFRTDRYERTCDQWRFASAVTLACRFRRRELFLSCSTQNKFSGTFSEHLEFVCRKYVGCRFWFALLCAIQEC